MGDIDNIGCSPEEIQDVLQYSLAAVHHQTAPSSGIQFYNLHYDATWLLALALNNTVNGAGAYYDNTTQLWDALYSEVSGSGSECNWLANYRSSGFAPFMMKRHILAMDFTGLSVSTYFSIVIA